MAVTLSQRLGLTRWGAGADPLRRTQLDNDNRLLDELVAIDRQGTAAQRPAASAALRGVYWTTTDTADAGTTYRCDGAEWRLVNGPRTRPGAHTFTITGDVQLAAGDAFYVPPFPVRAPAGVQTAQLVGLHALLRSGAASVQLVRITAAGVRTVVIGPVEVGTGARVTAPAAPVQLGDLDLIGLEVTTLGVTPPRNLSATALIDYRT